MKRILPLLLFLAGIISAYAFLHNKSVQPHVLQQSIERGKLFYQAHCALCHQPDGGGIAGLYPPLSGSDFLAQNQDRAIHILLFGLAGPIIVNGQPYNGVMHPVDGTDQQLADVLTYVHHSFGNHGPVIYPEMIAGIRASGRDAVWRSLNGQ